MKTSTPPLIPDSLVRRATEALKRVVEPMDGVHLALLCTPDGREIASLHGRSAWLAERLPALTASLMALAGSAALETGHGACRRLRCETEMGTLLFQAVGGDQPAIICLVIDDNMLLGRALWAAAEVASQLRG
ncbi:MAG: roadblock/LC7 domain-containing protein [Burkholderiaceae bacterium]|nr:roadblock/LC7 domain-containing protein [Burkholderiaceae bacterium]